MNKINFYGKDYDKADEIVCDCGCIFKKDNCEIGISFSDKFLCEQHAPKIDIEKLKTDKINEIKDKTEKELRKTDYKILKYVEGQLNIVEFDKIKKDRELLRSKYKEKEKKIMDVKNIEDLNNLDMEGE